MIFQKIQQALFILSFLAMAAGAFALGFFGLNLGVDFTGGSLLQVEWQGERPLTGEIRKALQDLKAGSLSVQHTGERGVLVRMSDISQESHELALSLLGEEAQELSFESIGPVIGKELQGKTLLLVSLAVGAVVAYIAFAFRTTAGSVRPWHWSAAALAASFHDVLLPLGVFALLGEYAGMQIGIPVVVALLTVVGYSVNDTVVVFDRIRENLQKRAGLDFADIIKRSLQQTWFRSLSTSLTTMLVLLSVYLWGGETLAAFALMLMVGIAAGTFSSLFLAPSLLLLWKKQLF